MEHIARLRPCHALADIEDIGDHKDRENRTFGCNQAIHSHGPTRGKIPAEIIFLNVDGCCTHDVTRNSSRDLPDALGPKAAAGFSLPGSSRSCTPVVASWLTIRGSTHPRDRPLPACPGSTTKEDCRQTPAHPPPGKRRRWSR